MVDFHKRILFSDEAHFWLNGYVNKQNCRLWSEANPQVHVETPLHPEKLTVWCALWAGGIIGPYFFKNDEGHNVTVNGDRYRAMITNFFIPELNNHDVQELWFQQDGATCHTARATIDLLKDTFGDCLISRFGPVNWPPRSCDLTPLDYFLLGYVKSLVYADKPQTLDHLEDNIRRVIADIRPQMLEKVIENWTFRLDYIRASRGSPMPEIIFKISFGSQTIASDALAGISNSKMVSFRNGKTFLSASFQEYLKSDKWSQGKQTALRYPDTLEDQEHPAILPFYTDGDRYFKDDNATTIHHARSAQKWFAEHQSDFQYLPWPPHNPDFNPIENVRDMVERHFRQHSTLQSNLQNLKSSKANTWYFLVVNALQKHVDSMPKQLKQLFEQKVIKQNIDLGFLIRYSYL
ncbi:transposable element Tc3 transposase [Trichonephila clavipes]|nr:transposable element Tc3 transposase [Trichonephila clavipes]